MSKGVVSKMVERRQRNAGDLLSAIKQHEAQVAGELEATLGGGVGGSEVVGVGSVLRAMVRAEEGRWPRWWRRTWRMMGSSRTMRLR